MYKGKKKKTSNRSRILECIYRNAPIARTDIAEETEITPATVTMNVTSLISEGFVRELGEASTEEGSSGRKRVLIDLIPDSAYSIGLEFTQKALVVCITDLKGRICFQHVEPFREELASRITDAIIESVKKLVADSKIPWDRIVGIGTAVPGHMNGNASSLVTNRKTWQSFDPKRIERELPLPVVFENNARCMALGEYLFSPQKSPDSFAFFHVGMGMFCANVVEGEMFLGDNYVAGEIGHTIVSEGGRRCECGKYGCLQTYASENHLIRNARLMYRNIPHSLLRNLAADESQITIETITTAYSMGDPVIGMYITEALKYLGITASNIAIITNPGKIFLHGQLFNNQDIQNELMDYIKRQLIFVDSTYAGNVEILPYAVTDGAVGASALAILRFFIRPLSGDLFLPV